MSKDDNIRINYESCVYIIPNSNKLVEYMSTIGKPLSVTIMDNNQPYSITKKECKVFFIENSNIFIKYLEKIIKEDTLNDRFSMYISNIIFDIKNKKIEDDVDEYWKNMLYRF